MTMPFRKLLALTDLSPASRPGLELAERVARRLEARVMVGYAHTRVDILRDFTREVDDAVRLASWVRSEDERRLQELSAECIDPLRLKGVVTVDASNGRSGVELLIAKTQPDVVVMATHGRTGMKHLLLGSIAEHTLRAALCPVLLTRHGQFPAQGAPLRVLAGLELGDGDGDLVKRAAAFVGGPDTKNTLTLAHVVQSMYLSPMPYGTEFAMPQPDMPLLLEAAQKSVEQLADTELPDLADRTTAVARPGRPGPGLVDVADDCGADLVVLRTHARTGLNRMWLGSVSEYVVRHCEKAAVLVYPPAAASG